MAERSTPTPAEQVTRLYEQAETQAAQAGERLVGSGGFASLLGQMAENVAVLTRMGNDAMDLVLRNLRVAGRRDIIRLSQQLGRTEDKLERLLQELEQVRDAVDDRNGALATARRSGSSASAAAGQGASASRQNARGSAARAARARSGDSGSAG